jgi:hypothetical protein
MTVCNCNKINRQQNKETKKNKNKKQQNKQKNTANLFATKLEEETES